MRLTDPMATPTIMPTETVYLALIAMIGMAIKQYLDTRALIAKMEMIARDAKEGVTKSVETLQVAKNAVAKSEEAYTAIQILDTKTDGRLTQLLESRALQSKAEANLAHAQGLVAGGIAEAARIASTSSEDTQKVADAAKDAMNALVVAAAAARQVIADQAADARSTIAQASLLLQQHESLSLNESGKIDPNVLEVWGYLRNRAIAEVMAKGLVTMPGMIVTDEAKSWYSHLIPELKEWYKANANLDRLTMFTSCHKTFGKRLLAEICNPYGLFDGACVELALLVAEQCPDLTS